MLPMLMKILQGIEKWRRELYETPEYQQSEATAAAYVGGLDPLSASHTKYVVVWFIACLKNES